jgi:hypothetical protein
MHSQVQCDWNPRHSCVSNKLSVAEKCGRAMMVGVEEGERLLFEDKEESVDEFEIFGQVVQLHRSQTR